MPHRPFPQLFVALGVSADAALAALSQSTKWVEKRTADDVPYFFEPSSETVTWEKPDCLKSPEELESNSGPWAWVRYDMDGFLWSGGVYNRFAG